MREKSADVKCKFRKSEIISQTLRWMGNFSTYWWLDCLIECPSSGPIMRTQGVRSPIFRRIFPFFSMRYEIFKNFILSAFFFPGKFFLNHFFSVIRDFLLGKCFAVHSLSACLSAFQFEPWGANMSVFQTFCLEFSLIFNLFLSESSSESFMHSLITLAVLARCSIDWLIDWSFALLIDRLIDRLIVWSFDWLIVCSFYWLIDCLVHH